jgi:DNA-binding cell septation regulator SpoVG
MPTKAKPAGASGGHRTITVCNWKPLNRGGLRGFLTLTLASGLIIHNCQLIEAGGRPWVGLPSLRFSRSDGSVYYVPVLDFVTRRARRNFERSALEAVEAFLKARGEW